MKRVIRASMDDRVIFSDEMFELRRDHGIGIKNTPWTGLEVISKGPAEKHAVEVRLNPERGVRWEGEPVELEYSDAYVAHGMRGIQDTLEDTEEYIAVLEDAVEFARRVNKWLISNR